MKSSTKAWIGTSVGTTLLWLLFRGNASAAAAGGVYTSDQEAIMAKIRTEALKQGVPPELALATGELESNFQNIKASKGESYGPMQVHTSSGYTPAQLQDVDFNIKVGVGIIKARLKAAKGDSLLARVMYFCGVGWEKSCSEDALTRLKTRWAPVAAKWGVLPQYSV